MKQNYILSILSMTMITACFASDLAFDDEAEQPGGCVSNLDKEGASSGIISSNQPITMSSTQQDHSSIGVSGGDDTSRPSHLLITTINGNISMLPESVEKVPVSASTPLPRAPVLRLPASNPVKDNRFCCYSWWSCNLSAATTLNMRK